MFLAGLDWIGYLRKKTLYIKSPTNGIMKKETIGRIPFFRLRGTFIFGSYIIEVK